MDTDSKFTEIPINDTKYSLILIHDSSWEQDGISPSMVIDSGVEDGISYIIIQSNEDAMRENMISIGDKLPRIGETVWAWDEEQPNCKPIKDERLNSKELEWKVSYGVTHWEPLR